MEPLWSDARGSYSPAQSMVQANMLLVHAVAAMAGHGGPARRDDRAAADRRAAVPRAVVQRDRRPRLRPAARARLARRLRPAPGDRRAGGLRADRGLGGARGARAPAGTGGADRGLHRAHCARALLALSDDPAQPDRLVLPHVRVGGDGRGPARPDGRPDGPGAPLRRPGQAPRPRPRGAQPRPRLPLPLPAQRHPPQPVQPGLAGVREPHARLPARLRRRAGARDGRARRPPGGCRAGVGGARAVRLLDARRLPELGHRARLPPLAPGQEGRPGPAGPARHRARPGPPSRRLRRVGQVPARRGLRVLRPGDRAQRRVADRELLRRPVGGGERLQPQPVGGALRRQRRQDGARRHLRPGRRGAPAAVRLRPRRRAARDHDALLQHGRRPGEPQRVPLRRPRRGAPVRRQPGGRGDDRRRRQRGLRHDGARRRRAHAAGLAAAGAPAQGDQAAAPHARAQGHREAAARLSPAAVRGAVPRAAGGGQRERRTASRSPSATTSPSAGSTPAGPCAPRASARSART